MASKARDRTATSSRPGSPVRTDRSPAATRLAAAVSRRTGRTACRPTSSARPLTAAVEASAVSSSARSASRWAASERAGLRDTATASERRAAEVEQRQHPDGGRAAAGRHDRASAGTVPARATASRTCVRTRPGASDATTCPSTSSETTSAGAVRPGRRRLRRPAALDQVQVVQARDVHEHAGGAPGRRRGPAPRRRPPRRPTAVRAAQPQQARRRLADGRTRSTPAGRATTAASRSVGQLAAADRLVPRETSGTRRPGCGAPARRRRARGSTTASTCAQRASVSLRRAAEAQHRRGQAAARRRTAAARAGSARRRPPRARGPARRTSGRRPCRPRRPRRSP